MLSVDIYRRKKRKKEKKGLKCCPWKNATAGTFLLCWCVQLALRVDSLFYQHFCSTAASDAQIGHVLAPSGKQ
jgi:hypothetical protein